MGPASCYYCCTTEGEPELCTLTGISNSVHLQYGSGIAWVASDQGKASISPTNPWTISTP